MYNFLMITSSMKLQKLCLVTFVSALFYALSAGLSPAWGQSQELEEIVVTGSRISREPADHVGPMSVIDGEDIALTPNYSVQDMLLKLPSIGLQGSSRNNADAGRGAHFSGIHQLTPERTLVLMNGRRMVHTIRDSLGLGVDLQSFPINMIDGIEVLADGASAIYGSDAGNCRLSRTDGTMMPGSPTAVRPWMK